MDNSKKLLPIGGEFWFDLNLFNKEAKSLDKFIKLSGGQSSINYIIDCIKLEEDEVVLLPSFLCPSILHWFKRKNVKYFFYKVKKDLSIDLEELELHIKKFSVKAVFFINYFGFHHNEEELNFLLGLKKNGIILIEDAVQMFWTEKSHKFIGNFTFNSFRKFVPVDGSIVVCDGYKQHEALESLNSYLEMAYTARMKKTLFEVFGIGREEDFLKCFELADKAYYEREDIYPMDDVSRKLIEKFDVEFIKSKRAVNYRYLYGKLKEAGIKLMFEELNFSEATPLGLPILIDNRDIVRRQLRSKHMYCPVHWDIRNEKWISNTDESYYVADRILTLPIDQRYNEEDMDRLFNELIALVNV